MVDQELGADPAGYEPPRLERVLTSEELEDEILYAGMPAASPDFV
jgi:hypothetical protein